MKRIVKLESIISVLLGGMFTAMVLIAYWGNFQYIYELTFLSNALTGLFLLTTTVLKRKGKEIPQILYLDFTVLLFMVFLICIAFISEFTFTGAVFFLHVINPLALLVYFFIYIDMNKISKVSSVLTIVIMPLAYLVFAVIFGGITDNYIYFFLNYKEKGIDYSVIFVCIVAVGLIAISYGIFYLNRFLHRGSEK
ncbi:MAG: hypothetical protein WBI07_07550 [Mobilitalea sp.]